MFSFDSIFYKVDNYVCHIDKTDRCILNHNQVYFLKSTQRTFEEFLKRYKLTVMVDLLYLLKELSTQW